MPRRRIISHFQEIFCLRFSFFFVVRLTDWDFGAFCCRRFWTGRPHRSLFLSITTIHRKVRGQQGCSFRVQAAGSSESDVLGEKDIIWFPVLLCLWLGETCPRSRISVGFLIDFTGFESSRKRKKRKRKSKKRLINVQRSLNDLLHAL